MADDKIFDAKDLLGDFKKETEKAKQEVAKELQEVGKSIIADVKAMKQDVKKQVESQQKLVGKIEADIDVVLSSDNISDTVKQQMTTIKKEIEKEAKKSTATQLSASFSVINKGQIKDAQRLGGQVRTAYESALEGKKNAPKRFVEYFSAGKYKDSIDSEYGFAIPFKEKEFSEMENYYNELITSNKQLQEVAKLASQEMEKQIHLIEQQRKATGALREQLNGTNIKKSSLSSQQSGNQTEVLSGDTGKPQQEQRDLQTELDVTKEKLRELISSWVELNEQRKSLQFTDNMSFAQEIDKISLETDDLVSGLKEAVDFYKQLNKSYKSGESMQYQGALGSMWGVANLEDIQHQRKVIAAYMQRMSDEGISYDGFLGKTVEKEVTGTFNKYVKGLQEWEQESQRVSIVNAEVEASLSKVKDAVFELLSAFGKIDVLGLSNFSGMTNRFSMQLNGDDIDSLVEKLLKFSGILKQIPEVNQTPLSSDSKAKKYNIANRTSVPKLKSDIDSSDEDSDIDEITNAYKILINTEKRYQNLKRKETEGIITPTEIGNLKMLTEERERANRITENAISLNEEQIKISKKYATVQSDVEKAILETAKANEKLIASRLQEEIDKIETNKKDFKYDSAYEAELNSVSDTIKALNMQAENLEFVDEEDIQDFVRLRQAAESALDALKTKTNNLQFKTPDVEDVKKKMVEIQKVMDQNTKMPREMKETFEALQNKYKLLIDTKGSVSQFKALNAELEDMIFNLQKSGKTGKSFFSQIGQRLTDMNAKFFATYFSLQDIIRYTRQGFETIKEYDTALTEMNKVSKESIQTLKEFQEESFALANSVGTAASQVQNSTADFLRLGESFEQAKESAQDANALFKVSEFTDISEATDALIAMSAAYKELEKSEINDILNYTGNNFSISTSELASALQKSAATLKVAGNDIYEATALVTAGNAVLQDAETVGAGKFMPEYIVICRYF